MAAHRKGGVAPISLMSSYSAPVPREGVSRDGSSVEWSSELCEEAVRMYRESEESIAAVARPSAESCISTIKNELVKRVAFRDATTPGSSCSAPSSPSTTRSAATPASPCSASARTNADLREDNATAAAAWKTMSTETGSLERTVPWPRRGRASRRRLSGRGDSPTSRNATTEPASVVQSVPAAKKFARSRCAPQRSGPRPGAYPAPSSLALVAPSQRRS